MEGVPLGFRFYPTEEELISFYLHKQLEGNREKLNRVIPVINVYELEPWHLPKVSGEMCHGDTEQWFFFTPRQEREARGGRPNRTTAAGYWKATGSPSYVYSSDNRVIGVKKAMVFYKGKAPTGRKTKWKMNEYRAIEEVPITSSCVIPKLRQEMSLCRVYVTSGSCRAFDRRPLGATTRETLMNPQANEYGVARSAHNNTAKEMEKTSSPGSNSTSSSGGEGHFEFIQNVGDTNWEMRNGVEPLWEWEQLNLL